MTEKLYYEDSYISEFDAKIISSTKTDNGYDVILDRTAFFPEEGGQYSDRGTINGARVFLVSEKDGIIHHYTESPTSPGYAKCSIDFDERFEKMQCHTAEHILSGIIHKKFGLDNVGFHLGGEDVTMDISAPLTKEELFEVERLANEIIYKNVKIETSFPTFEELKSLEYRSKLDLTDNVRIVTIGEYDSCACCAPHVNYTGEIGLVKIIDFVKLRGGMRLFITAGRRAMRAFGHFFENAQKISSMLSVPKSEIATGVERLLDENNRTKCEYSEYRIKAIEREAAEAEEKSCAVFVFEDATISEMIAFSNIASPKIPELLVLLSGCDRDYKYVICSQVQNLKDKSAEINKSLLGRGGGRPNMIQGSLSATLEDVKRYFNL